MTHPVPRATLRPAPPTDAAQGGRARQLHECNLWRVAAAEALHQQMQHVPGAAVALNAVSGVTVPADS